MAIVIPPLRTHHSQTSMQMSTDLPARSPRSASPPPRVSPRHKMSPGTLNSPCHRRSRSLDDSNQKKLVLDLSHPNRERLVSMMGHLIAMMIETTHAPNEPFYLAFDERWCPFDIERFAMRSMPTPKTVAVFIWQLAAVGRVDNTSLVLVIHLLRRFKHLNPYFVFSIWNWKPLLAGLMILSCKLYEDLGVRNTDFMHRTHFPYLSVRALNNLEASLLRCLNFNVHWSVNDYAASLIELNSWYCLSTNAK